MTADAERRLLQLCVGLACLVPLSAGGAGVIMGPAMLKGAGAAPPDLESHFRYLSGLLLAIGVAFAAAVPSIERKGALFRLLGFLVVVGGLARLVGALTLGLPGKGHIFGLCMELIVTPALVLWQARVARRCDLRR